MTSATPPCSTSSRCKVAECVGWAKAPNWRLTKARPVAPLPTSFPPSTPHGGQRRATHVLLEREFCAFAHPTSDNSKREAIMKIATALTALACAMLASTSLVLAADVTPQRLANPEPHNWLMNHRTYDAQRYSPLARISKDNVKNLKLAYAVAIGGQSINEHLQATPLVEDGFMYVVDVWGIVYKIDVRSGE